MTRARPLRDTVESDEYDHLLSQLLNGLALGPDATAYELWKGAPVVFSAYSWIASTLFQWETHSPPRSWLGGLVRFLFKKGRCDVLRLSCCNLVCPLDTAYKILSAILTDRLYPLAERYCLLDAIQEGFCKLQCCCNRRSARFSRCTGYLRLLQSDWSSYTASTWISQTHSTRLTRKPHGGVNET